MIFAFVKAQGINKIYAPGKVMIMNYALCIVHCAFGFLKLGCLSWGMTANKSWRFVLVRRLFAFASVSPDGFRQWMRGAQRVMRSAQRVKSQG